MTLRMRHSQGHTLPELLIGLTLGLLIIAAATRMYSVSKLSWLSMSAADAVHANARVALRNLREQAQLVSAAYVEPSTHNTVHLTLPEEAGQAHLSGINGSKTTESLSLGHWHALDALDCQGNVNSTQTTVRNDYKLNTHQELSCKDLNLSNSTYQALAEGVEDFQVRYAQADPSTQTLQWKTANQVSDMSRVMAVEVCLRVASIYVVHSAKPSDTRMQSCQGEVVEADGRLRRVFKRVFTLDNRAGLMP